MKRIKFYLKGTSFMWLPILGGQLASIVTDISSVNYIKMLFCFILPFLIVGSIILIEQIQKELKAIEKVVISTFNRSKSKYGNHYITKHTIKV